MNLNEITNTGTWGQQVTRLNDNFNKVALGIDTLQSAYRSLSQSAPEVVDTLPQTGEANKIYRLVGTTSYSDYMYNADDLNTPILMATYNNAIEQRPKKASQNLVTSGGVFDNMGALDVSELNATENPHTLAQYVDLSAALAAVPTAYQKGGMSVKFVHSSENKYVQYRYMLSDVSTAASFTNVNNWDEVGCIAQKISELGFIPTTPLSPNSEANNWKLLGNGLCSSDNSYKMVKYLVNEGDVLKLHISKESDGVMQFQSAASVPASGVNGNLVGSAYTNAVDELVKVPAEATYLIVSQLKTTTTNIVEKLAKIDEKPTNGSKNIVESGGVFDFSDWQVMPSNNGQSYSDNNIIFNETSVTFGSEGILVASPSGDKYYIARSDRNTETISVDLSFYRAVVYVDKTKLVVNSRVNSISSCIVFVDSWEKNANYIPFLYQISNKFYPIGQFVAIKSIIDANKAIQQISTFDNKIGEIFLSGNNERLFKRVSISENKITIKTDGFSVFRKTDSAIKLLGYVGYVSGTDASDTYLIEGDTDTIRYAWFVDLNTLNRNNRTAFSVAIKKIVLENLNEQTIPSGYLLLATSYKNSVMSPLIQSSLNEDKGGVDDVPFNLSIFEPDFYAYLNGRFNNAAGTGQRWYKRFCITHISDVHQYNDLMREALEVSQTKADIIINTGDNGNGNASTTRTQSQSWLSGTAALVNGSNSIPYIEAKGNHDVCNITLSDWRGTIGSLISSYSSSFVWGGENVGYGYVDIAGDSDMGSFRIILLDPFDYADGLFPSTRAFQSATFSQAQINWLINTLVYAANNGLHVITAMHYSFGDNPSWSEENARPDAIFYQDPFMIPDIIDTIQNKSVINKTYSDSQNIANITVNENFANVGDLDFVCHLFGHIHSKNEYWCKKSNGSKEYDILMLGEAALGTYGNALNKVYRNPGTVNEIEFSALCVDTIEKTIYRISYGAYKKYDLSNNARSEKFSYRKANI